jgi:hypothetical protein
VSDVALADRRQLDRENVRDEARVVRGEGQREQENDQIDCDCCRSLTICTMPAALSS